MGVFCAACQWPAYHMNKDTEMCELCEGSKTASLAASIAGVCLVVLAMVSMCVMARTCEQMPSWAKLLQR